MKYTIFYDATCPFCKRWKSRIEKWDKKKIFTFQPQKTPVDTMVLMEGDKRLERGKAVLRIFWLLGWYVPGCFYILPKWVIDPIYNLVASHRTCQ